MFELKKEVRNTRLETLVMNLSLGFIRKDIGGIDPNAKWNGFHDTYCSPLKSDEELYPDMKEAARKAVANYPSLKALRILSDKAGEASSRQVISYDAITYSTFSLPDNVRWYDLYYLDTYGVKVENVEKPRVDPGEGGVK